MECNRADKGKMMAFPLCFFIITAYNINNMTIETKFSIGDEVWVMKDNKPHSFTIGCVDVKISVSPSGCNYGWYKSQSVIYADLVCDEKQYESDLYASKEELLASL